MTTTLILFAFASLIAAGVAGAIWAYWVLIFPVAKKHLAFRIERSHDQFRLLALRKAINQNTEVYARLESFFRKARTASTTEGWLSFKPVPADATSEKKMEVADLVERSKHLPPEVRKVVDDAINDLVGLYVAQRPMLVVFAMPLLAAAFFVNRARRMLESKEIEYAAGSLSLAH